VKLLRGAAAMCFGERGEEINVFRERLVPITLMTTRAMDTLIMPKGTI
jgi:hypothetical protein